MWRVVLGGVFLGATLATSALAARSALNPSAIMPPLVALSALGFALGRLCPRPARGLLVFVAPMACAIFPSGALSLGVPLVVAAAVGGACDLRRDRARALFGLATLVGLAFGLLVWSSRTTLAQQAALLSVLGLLLAATTWRGESAARATIRLDRVWLSAARAGVVLASCLAIESVLGVARATWLAQAVFAIAVLAIPRLGARELAGAGAIAACFVPVAWPALPLVAVACATCAGTLRREATPVERALGVGVAAVVAVILTAANDSLLVPVAFGAALVALRPRFASVVAVSGAVGLGLVLAHAAPAHPLEPHDFTELARVHEVFPRTGGRTAVVDARVPLDAERLAKELPPSVRAAWVPRAFVPALARSATTGGRAALAETGSSASYALVIFTRSPHALAHRGWEPIAPGPLPNPWRVWRDMALR